MKTITRIFVASVFVNTIIAVEQKQVNIALETVLRFGKKDQTSGLDVIDKVQNALEKIKEGMEVRSSRRRNSDDMTFADFVSEAAKVLKDYNDNDLEDVFVVIGEESRKYINRKGELRELFGTGNIRRHLNEQLDGFAEMQANTLRRHLNKAITAVENQKYNGQNNDLLDIGNYLYIGGNDKLKAALRNLEKLRRATDVRLEDVLRDTLKSLIFDHFSDLNDNIKRELIEMAKDYWRAYGDRSRGKYTRSSRFKSVDVAQFTHKNDRNRLNLDAQRHMSKLRSILRDRKTNNADHKNKRYKYKSRAQKDRETDTAYTKLHKFKDNTRMLIDSEEKTYSTSESESDKSMSSDNIEDQKPKKVTKRHNLKKNKFTPSLIRIKRPKYSSEEPKPIDSPYADFMLLTGGQHAHDVDVRGKISSEDVSEEPNKTKETLKASKKTVEHHPTAAYISVERFITKNKKKSLRVSKEEVANGTVTVSVANVSGEGLSIESFETERNIADKVKRKFIKNDTIKIENQEARLNFRNMIKNIEKQIEDVKEQVDYVKNLTVDTYDKPENPKFKALHSGEIYVTTLTKSKSKSFYPNSDSLERDNEAFFSRYNSERIDNIENDRTSGLALRAHDEYTTQLTTVTKINESNITKSVTHNITTKATIPTIIVNNTKENKTVPNTSPIDEKILNILTNTEFRNNKTQGIKENHNSIEVSTVNMKLNEIDTKNVTVDTKRRLENYGFNPLDLNFTKNLEFSDDNFGMYK